MIVGTVILFLAGISVSARAEDGKPSAVGGTAASEEAGAGTAPRNPFLPKFPKKAPPPVEEKKSTDPAPSFVPPMTPQQKKAIEPPKPPPVTLSGLVWNTNFPQAIVNGEIVAVGDMIQNWKITDISQKGVTIVSGETTFTIEP